jgi:hypothetical protein
MAQDSGLCGLQAVADSPTNLVTFRTGNQGELVAGEMTGKHFEQTLRGRVFTYTVTGQALLLAATTGGHPTLINPGGNAFIFIPLSLTLSYVSGTTVIGSVVIGDTLNVAGGGGVATGSSILTATKVAPVNTYRGNVKNYASNMIWSPTTNTFTAAPTINEGTSINLGAADPTNSGNPHVHYFNGASIYGPGSAMSICYSVATSTALFTITLKGIEMPLPQTA